MHNLLATFPDLSETFETRDRSVCTERADVQPRARESRHLTRIER